MLTGSSGFSYHSYIHALRARMTVIVYRPKRKRDKKDHSSFGCCLVSFLPISLKRARNCLQNTEETYLGKNEVKI
jgi:hypothetical protein